jgi:phospholipase C
VDHVAVQLEDHNGGFVRDFAGSFPQSSPAARQFIMGYYPRGFLPALHALAADFTICDRWHASLPGPTWPNRFFALSGTSLGRIDMPGDGTHGLDLPGYFEQTQPTLFDRLNERGIPWKVYFHDIPQTTCFAQQREPHNVARYFYIDEFFDDARGPEEDFPAFSLIEPSYMGWGENDDHPPHDIMRAEKLIADVYNAIRGNDPLWRSTLLVVFYDEHGGFFDHVEPPSAPAPDDRSAGYPFDRLGVRVPALLVSPWVGARVEHTLFDHTSVLKYFVEKWRLGDLGRRTAAANSIGAALDRTNPRTDTVSRIALSPEQLRPPDPGAEEMAFDRMTTHQSALQALTAFLKNELVTDAPLALAWLARCFEGLKAVCEGALTGLYREPAQIRVTIADPDKLAHHNDAAPRDAIVRFLMRRKRQAVAHFARQIRDDSLPKEQRDHAVHTLGVISGRKYHREERGLDSAQAWLQRHGQ